MVNDNKVFKSFSWSTKGDPIKKGKREHLTVKLYQHIQ